MAAIFCNLSASRKIAFSLHLVSAQTRCKPRHLSPKHLQYKSISTATPLPHRRASAQATPPPPPAKAQSRTMATMRAVAFDKTGDSSVLSLREDMPKPTASASQILVKVEWHGINFIDTYMRTGLYQFATPPPHVSGTEGGGIVEAVGAEVPADYGLEVGDRVAFMKSPSAAEYAAVNPNLCFKLPEGVSTKDGAAFLLQGLTAWTLVRDAHEVKPGEVVLVQAAAGGTGGLVVQMCKHLGATVIGTVSTDAKAKLAREHGCDHVVVYTRDDVLKAVNEITHDLGCHAVFSGVGKATFEQDLAATRRKGSFITFGNASGAVEPFSLFKLTARNVRLMRPTLFNFVATREEWDARCRELFDLLAKGVVKTHIGGVYDLSEVAKAQDDLTGQKTVGKLLVKVAKD
ncbi:hypothetical protein MCOR06_005833 [Pyricularia oryzae]|nr:hypothetical protein MCOR06_005833 [Pyricularia oryzae]